MVLKDDNGTPNDPADDFSPTYVSGDNGVIGTLEPGETWIYTATVTPPIQLTANNVNGYTGPAGTLTSQVLANGDIRITYRQSTNVNDNTYGTGVGQADWPSGAHVQRPDRQRQGRLRAEGHERHDGDEVLHGLHHRFEHAGDGGRVRRLLRLPLAGRHRRRRQHLDRQRHEPVRLRQHAGAGPEPRGLHRRRSSNSPLDDPNWDVRRRLLVHRQGGGLRHGGLRRRVDLRPAQLAVEAGRELLRPDRERRRSHQHGHRHGHAQWQHRRRGRRCHRGGRAAAAVAAARRSSSWSTSGVDDTFKYSPAGASVGNFALQAGNTDPRDIAANADGSKLWVLDKDKNVNVYNSDGTAQGLWKADGLGTEPEGITLDGNDLWMADRDRKIHWYDDAAANTSGTDKADKTFAPVDERQPEGHRDRRHKLWVVTEGGTDYVYRFTIARDGSGNPTGLTQDGQWKLATRQLQADRHHARPDRCLAEHLDRRRVERQRSTSTATDAA